MAEERVIIQIELRSFRTGPSKSSSTLCAMSL